MLQKVEIVILMLVIFVFALPRISLPQEAAKEKKKETKAIEVGEVVVTATKTKRTLADLTVEANVINTEQIENSNAQTVGDLLKYIPGIDTSLSEDRAGTNPWKATFRGLRLNEGYGLILVDGQRIKGGGMGEYGYGLNQIPPEMIERIEVVKGPSSVLYGSDAMAGVVNIITKPTPEKRIFSCVQGYGTHDVIMQGLTYGDKIDKFGYFLNAQMEKSEAAKYGGEDEYEGHHIQGKVGYELDKGKRLDLGINWDRNDWLYGEEEGLRISPGWETEFADGSKLILRGYWYNWDFHHFSPGSTERKGDMGYRQVESQYTRLLSDKHLVTGGFEFLQEGIDYNLVDKTVNTRGLFLQDEWAALNNLNIVIGVRLDSHSEFGSEVNPKISGLLRFSEKTRFRASIGRSFKSPTIRQLYYTVPFKHKTYYIQSNPDLDPEYGIGYSLGVTQEIGDKFSANLSIFRNDVDDMVIRYDVGQTYLGLPLRSYKNVAEAYTQGVEMGLKAQLIKSVSSNLSYTLLDTEDKETDKELTDRPKHTAGWHLNYNNQQYGFNVNWGLRYIGSMFIDSANTQESDHYVIGEIKLVKNISKQAKLSLEIDNLFNSNYGCNADYQTPKDKGREGRTLMGKIIVRF